MKIKRKIFGNPVNTPANPQAMFEKTEQAKQIKEFATHKKDTKVHVTEEEKTYWNAKLDASKIPEIVAETLTQAKASGEFNGQDGKTPQKNVDYFTEADKQEFLSDVLNALPTWQGGAY